MEWFGVSNMATKKITKLAQTVNAQVNPNATKLIDWKNCDKALTDTTKTYATSYANRKKVKNKYVDNHPWTLTAHKFGLNIPTNAYVTKVQFLVRMRTRGKYKVWKPPEARFNIYGSAYSKKHDEKRTVNTTGWEKGIYYVDIGAKHNLSSSWQTFTYEMNESNIKKGGFKSSNWNAEVMGIDLKFFNPVFFANADTKKEAEANIDVAWVKLVISYEIPTYNITYKTVSTTGRTKCVRATFTNSSKANGGTQVLDVEIPWGTDLVSPTSTTNGFNPSTKKWTVNAKANAKTSVDFCINTYLEGEQTLKIGNTTTGKFPYSYVTPLDLDDGYDDISLSLESEPHKNHTDCLIVGVEGQSSDDSLTLTTTMNKAFTNVGWSLDNGSDGVELASTSGNSVTLTVPQGERFTAYLRHCFIPTTTGSYTATVTADDGKSKSLDFNVGNPYVYHIGSTYSDGDWNANLTTDYIKWNTHRVASEIGTDATVIPLRSDEYDSVMHIPPSTLHLKKWDELNYIGCVPLEHLHFDPKSTYKDKLLDTHYKNKRYMGKQLASDEDITLNVRLHPQQVTTIQGLIDMDKPIPINANYKIWEGDALNHRGWAEIYGITATKTNEHWYKCEIDVKYLTHNLNTRFKIDKGNKVNNQPINDLMAEVFERGEKLSNDITQDFFSIVTDGTYMYNESEVVTVDYLTSEGYEVYKDGTNAKYKDSNNVVHTIDTLANFVAHLEANNYDVITPTSNNETVKVRALLDVPTNQRNMFSIDNNQYVDIKTRDTLGASSEVIFDWCNVVLDELRENNVERIIELVSKTNDGEQAVFKYQYSDFQFDYDETTNPRTVESVRANPIAYVLRNGDWVTYTEEITLDTIIETGGIIDDTDEATPIDTSVDDDYQDDNTDTSELMIGSTIHFILDNHKLKVIDEGFNGREWEVPDLDLEGESYCWRTTWTNKNFDGESNDMVCFFDFSVSNTVFDGQYADKYSKLIVSPFPVSDKKLLFSREAEEGTVYYYEDDLEEFTYLIEPYYQYMNGCDLQSDSGISIFNLNYGYQLVYIQNGLVRLGFDRIDGRLYLAKYDTKQHEYVTTTHLRLDKYSDINVKSITDDKIEIQASDCIFTIWRGHPYIMINHQMEDILIDTRFNKVWAEKVGSGDAFELPAYWDLMNNANILPSCVGGGKEIRSSCIEVENIDDESKTATSLDWASGSTWTGFEVDTDLTFNLTSSNISLSDTIDIGNGNCVFGEYEAYVGHDYTKPSNVVLTGSDITQSGGSAQLVARVTNYDFAPLDERFGVDFIQKNKQIFTDNGLTGDNSSTSWIMNTTYVSQTVSTTGTTVANSDTSTYRLYTLHKPNVPVGYNNNWNRECTIEFDVLDYSGDIFLQQTGDGSTTQFKLGDVLTGTNGHIKIICDNSKVTCFVDEVQKSQLDNTHIGMHSIRFYLTASASFKYKNFRVYEDTSVLPIIFADNGVTGDSSSSSWNYNTTYISQSVSTTGTTVANSDTSGTRFYTVDKPSTSSDLLDWEKCVSMEFDLMSLNGTISIQQYDDTVRKSFSISSSDTDYADGNHIKIVNLKDKINLYVNGVLKSQLTNDLTDGLHGIRFVLGASASFKYQNFRIYTQLVPTDENGFATTTITGDGSGEEHYVAKVSNLISNDYVLIDGTFYDDGITDPKAVTWNNPSSYVSVTIDNDGTTLSNSSGTRHYWAKNYSQFSGNFAVEMDILEYVDNTNGGIRITGTNSNFIFKTYNVPQHCHLKLIFENGLIKYQINDGAITTYASGITDTSAYVGFRFVGSWSVKYRNFVAYQI